MEVTSKYCKISIIKQLKWIKVFIIKEITHTKPNLGIKSNENLDIIKATGKYYFTSRTTCNHFVQSHIIVSLNLPGSKTDCDRKS